MPIYNFLCKNKKCNQEYQLFLLIKEGFDSVKCPECGSKKYCRPMDKNLPHIVGTDTKMGIFDYRAEKNMENAQKHSRAAQEEAVKKKIKNPYNDLPDITDNGKKMNFIE